MNILQYRRQYIIGNKYIEEFEDWNKVAIGKNLFATVHPDLEYTQSEKGKFRLTLLGFLIDPYNPNMLNEDILVKISENISSFDDLLNETYSLSGRWIIIFESGDEIKFINDLVGFREVYYTFFNGQFWCGSDPSILKKILPIEKSTDKNMLDFTNSEYFKKTENAWYGNKTLYKEVYHLMPNHILDVGSKKTYRYWIDKENKTNLDEISKEAAEILKGSLIGANGRYNLMIGSTAGLDSRVLIAASKDISKDVFYFVSKMNLSDSHMDITTPSKLFLKLGLKLNVLSTVASVRDEIKNTLSTNISLSRNNPRNKALQYYLDFLPDKMNVNGVVSEITRNFYGASHPKDKDITSDYLIELIGYYGKSTFVKSELETWLDGVNTTTDNMKLSLVDLFYWEQRMGNWGCLTRNEQDLAIEGFMPYNNRKLIMLMASADSKFRQEPDYLLHKKIIENLWPETLKEPINPMSLKEKTIKYVSNHLPKKIKKVLKKLI